MFPKEKLLYFGPYLSMSSLYFSGRIQTFSLHKYFWMNEPMAIWMDGWYSLSYSMILIVWIQIWYPNSPLGIIRNFLSPRKSSFFPNKSIFPLVYTSASNNQTHSTILLIFYSRLNITWEIGAEESLVIFLKIYLASLLLPNDLLMKEFS